MDRQYDEFTIKPTSDLFTATLWSAPKNEPLLRCFLNAVMQDGGAPAIAEATVLNPFNIKEFDDDKKLVLDVRVRDESNRHYNIEVQSAEHSAFRNRVLLYWASTYASWLKAGEDFSLLVPVKSVILTGFPIFPELSGIHTIFEIRSRENSVVLLSDHFQMHFLRLGDMLKRKMAGLDVLDRPLQYWMNFFAFADKLPEDKMSQLVEKDPLVQLAYEEFQRFTADKEMRERIRDRERDMATRRLILNTERAEGRAEGKAEGKAEGRAEGKAETASGMLKEGFGTDVIARITGLSVAEIERLR